VHAAQLILLPLEIQHRARVCRRAIRELTQDKKDFFLLVGMEQRHDVIRYECML
jgi:hypothetical protein